MAKGSKQPTTSTVQQTNLPAYAEPYVKRLFERGESESLRAYEPYQSPRLASIDPTLEAGRSVAEGVGPSIPGLDTAQDVTAGLIDQTGGIAGLGPGQFNQYGYSPAGTYTADNISQYMNPYMQNVVDTRKNRAILDFDRAQAGRDANAVQAGAFGGSRQAVVDALAQEELSRNLGEIQAQGLNDAYDKGAGLFEADRAARMRTEQAQAAEQGRVEGAYDQSRLSFGELGLSALGQQGDLASQLAKYGGADRQAQLEYADILKGIGQDRMAENQQELDLAYQDFLRQQIYPQEQLQFYSDLLRGNIRGGNTTTQQFEQVNPFRDLLGAGISSIALNNLGAT